MQAAAVGIAADAVVEASMVEAAAVAFMPAVAAASTTHAIVAAATLLTTTAHRKLHVPSSPVGSKVPVPSKVEP